MSAALRQHVRDRAGARCEYCRFHEEHLLLWPFHLEHIVAEQHGGADELENLAWSCQRCNLHKGTNLSAIDPDSGLVVRLFHPRRDVWPEHFALEGGGRIRGVTPAGRATVWLLRMNAAERIEIRRLLISTGRW